MTHQEFIDTLVPLITKYCKQYNFPFVSPILAQAILESNWGTSYKAVAGLNFFGLKYTTAQRVPSASGLFLDGGSEQKTDGTYVPLSSKTAWCKFTSYDNGVHGYFEFLTNGGGRYDNLKLAVSPKDYLEKIKAANYATSLDYVVNLMKVINTNNLTQYDKYTIDNNIKKKNIMDNINIVKHTNTHNLTAIKNRRIEWIVLHYTAGVKSIAGTAKNVANWFANPSCKASADFIVDDNAIVQYNPDPINYYSWAVGGKKYTKLSTSLGAKYYGIVKNNNSISIEMCSRKKITSALAATDVDWYFTNETVQQAIKLTKYLMDLYHINIDHVIMHHHVTGKICPNPWCVNEKALTQWSNFLTQINKNQIQNSTPILSKSLEPFQVKVLVPNLNIRTCPNGAATGKFTGTGIFTIVDEKNNWGLLKAYSNRQDGWIDLSNPKFVQRI